MQHSNIIIICYHLIPCSNIMSTYTYLSNRCSPDLLIFHALSFSIISLCVISCHVLTLRRLYCKDVIISVAFLALLFTTVTKKYQYYIYIYIYMYINSKMYKNNNISLLYSKIMQMKIILLITLVAGLVAYRQTAYNR